MNELLNDEIIDLLVKRASCGLDAAEQVRFDKLSVEFSYADDESFDIAAAAIGLIDTYDDEPMPAHLQARIVASGDDFIRSLGRNTESAQAAAETGNDEFQKVFKLDPPRRSWNWLAWAVAAAACIALAVNVWSTRFAAPEIATLPKPPPTIQKPTVEEEYAKLLADPSGVVKAKWAPGAPTGDLKAVAGDVVWSDQQQKGFMRLKGLPVNDKSRSTYQLWIFDKTQDKATPIDGGTFDVDKNGEIIVPIDAKLKALGPELFAITIEKPGGVVVSKRDKMAAVAKVETQTKSST
ncbi:MAG: anti-sigma factor [Acidobacteriota bacterium]